MKKMHIRMILFLLSVLCMAGCKVEGGKENPTPTLSITDVFQPEKKPNAGDTEDGEILTEVLEPVAEKGQEDFNTVNRMQNHEAEKNGSLFCVDADTGVVYFVNQYQDYYIYRLKDGKAELAVPMPAKELCFHEGVLYFMVKSYDRYDLQGMQEADIYAYRPSKGTVEFVYAAGENIKAAGLGHLEPFYHKLRVDENGIYFVGDVSVKQVELNGKLLTATNQVDYCIAFGTTEPVALEGDWVSDGWREYSFGYAPGCMVKMSTRVKSEETDKEIGTALCYCVMGDDIYLLEGQKIEKINLITGESTVYACETLLSDFTEASTSSTLDSFTITEDSIWAVNRENGVFRFLREGGDGMYFKLNTKASIEKLYTDGQELYAVTHYGVARVVTEMLKEAVQGTPVVELEFLVNK